MRYIDNIPVWGEHEANTLEQAAVCARSADYFSPLVSAKFYTLPIAYFDPLDSSLVCGRVGA